MDMRKRVAVITRTKNRTVLLKRAVESVLAQSHDNWVHVIVNDGGEAEPVDRLVELYKERYGGRLRVLHHPQSLGMEAASNKGIAASESTYIAIHDDDDSWHPDFLKVSVSTLEESSFPTVKGVTTHTVQIFERIDNGSVTEMSRREFDPGLNAISLPEITETNKFMPISFVFCREALDEIGLFDESLPVIGDWDFNIRFLSKFDIRVVNQSLANYHVRVDKDGDYANTVTAASDMHDMYRALVINKYIRQDIRSGQVGLGSLMASGDYFYRLGLYTWRLVQILERMKRLAPIKFIRRLVRV